MNEAATVPTWGYRPDGSAEIFDLAPGESLPEGWHGTPDVIADPALRTAEAVSAAAARAAETNRLPTALPSAPKIGAKGAKVSHPLQAFGHAEALQAENARLVAEVAELRQGLAAAQAAHDEALARAEALAAQFEVLEATGYRPRPASDAPFNTEIQRRIKGARASSARRSRRWHRARRRGPVSAGSRGRSAALLSARNGPAPNSSRRAGWRGTAQRSLACSPTRRRWRRWIGSPNSPRAAAAPSC